MENKEIVTVVKKITDPAKISNLVIDNKPALIRFITGVRSLNEISLHTLPVNAVKNVNFKLKGNENVVYLGLRNPENNTFYETLPQNINSSNATHTFKVNPTNRIIDVPWGTFTMDDLIDGVNVKKLTEHYAITFSDLQDTKIVLGLYKRKMNFANTRINDYEIDLYEVYTLNNASSYIMTTALPGISSKHDDTGKVKFCIKDLTFIPLLNKKGYNLPKDRTVNKGKSVSFRYKGNNEKGVIVDIVSSKNNYTDKKGNPVTQKTYFIEYNGTTIRLRRQDFKLV